eukprot:COSAG05_NODE_13114_length_441_cov_0.906433_1_plen_30_part_10
MDSWTALLLAPVDTLTLTALVQQSASHARL